MKSIFFRCFIFALLFCSCSGAKTEQNTIKALLITGQNNHNWQVSHIALEKILKNSGLFSVDITTTPASGEDMSSFLPDFSSYSLVVLDYNGDAWPEETNKRFLEYTNNGGGILIYHAANNAFTQWKEFNEIIALGGWNGRNETSGPWVYWENGQLIRNTEPGGGGSHGAPHEFVLTERNTEHPVTKGLPARWKHAKDELYDRMRGPGNIKDLLYTAYSDTITGGSGREEPLIFTVDFGKARIFHMMLGHAGPTLEDNTAMQCAGFQTLVLRGSEWAATGKVTQEVPIDFPTEESISLRPDYR